MDKNSVKSLPKLSPPVLRFAARAFLCLSCFVAVFTSGCVTYYGAVRIKSDPPGAHVYALPSKNYGGKTPTFAAGKMFTKGTFRRRQCSTEKILLKKRGYKDTYHSFELCTTSITLAEAKANPQTVFVVLEKAFPTSSESGRSETTIGSRPIRVGCVFRPPNVRFRCDDEAVTELTVEVLSQGRPVPGADVIVEGGGCAPPTRYEDVIRGTTDSRGIFNATCTFAFQPGDCDRYYTDGSPDMVSVAHVTATALGYEKAYTQCRWIAKVPFH